MIPSAEPHPTAPETLEFTYPGTPELNVSATPDEDPAYLRVNGNYRVERATFARIRKHLQHGDLMLVACIEEHYREHIMAEGDADRRARLYQEAYSKLSRLHEARKQLDHGITSTFINLIRPYVAGKHILELGCGTGTFGKTVAPEAGTYTGIDASTDAVRVAGERNIRPNARFVVASATNPPEELGPFDVIYSNDFLEHLHPDDFAQTLRQCHRWLKPGGLMFSLIPNRLFGPFDVSRLYLREGSEARCLHLNEISHQEAIQAFSRAGFVRLRTPLGPLRPFVGLPAFLRTRIMVHPRIKALVERHPLARSLVGRAFGIRSVILFARKPGD